jgi:hypothetical protein
MFRSGGLSDLLVQRHVWLADQLYESGLRDRRLYGRLHAGSDALFGKQYASVRLERAVGFDDRMRVIGVRKRLVHGRVRAGNDAVLEQRRAAM